MALSFTALSYLHLGFLPVFVSPLWFQVFYQASLDFVYWTSPTSRSIPHPAFVALCLVSDSWDLGFIAVSVSGL